MIREKDAKAIAAIVKDMEALKAKYEDSAITGEDAEKFQNLHAELAMLSEQAKAVEMADDLKQLITQPVEPIVHNDTDGREVRSFMEQIFGKRAEFEAPQIGFTAEGDLKTLVGPTTSGGGYGVVHDRAEGVLMPMMPRTARDLFSQGTTASHAIEYFRQSARTINAAGVSEEITDSGSTNVKPESAVTFTLVTDTVKTIAHWIPATKNIMADWGQLEGILSNDLLYGLDIKEDYQLFNGSGGLDLQGVYAATSTQSHSRVSGDSVADTIRRMVTKSYLGGYKRPEWVAMTPQTLEGIEISKASTAGTYLYMVINGRIWGLTVYETPNLEVSNVHRMIVGNRSDAMIWDRESGNVEVGLQGSQFVQNQLTLLAEKRLAFGIKQPASYVYTTITEDTGGYIS